MHHWYLVHTKLRQEKTALENLERQGYNCVLPMIRAERLQRGSIVVVQEVLFPRYLFIQLATGLTAQSWAPIRSTSGVSRLVTFGQTPAKVEPELVEALRVRSASNAVHLRQFEAGQAVVVTQGPFAGLDAVYKMTDGEGRATVLLTILSKQVPLTISPSSIRKNN